MHIKAKTQGVVSSIAQSAGDEIVAGELILTTELMKMQTEYTAENNGVLKQMHVQEGDMVEPGQSLFDLSIETKPASQPSQTTTDTANSLIEELRDRRKALSDAGREKRVAKRHQSGGRTARENLADLLDEGSFSEIGGHALAAQHGTHSRQDLINRSAADGVLVGTGAVDGQPVAVLIVDYTVMAGTQGFFHHKKVDRIVDIARKRKLPLILYPEGGGGRPNDTDAHAITIAQLEITSFHHLAALRGVVPMVAVVHGYCFAGSAAFAAVTDVIIATESASLGMGGPAMIEGGGLGTHHPDAVGPSAMYAKNGIYDCVVKDEAQATKRAKKVLALLTNNSSLQHTSPSIDLNALMPKDRRTVFDVQHIIEGCFDTDSFVELKPEWAQNMTTGLARLEGKAVGVLANNCAHLGGAIDGVAAEKAALLFDLCERHNLPIVSLIDTPGFMVGPEAEATGQVRPIGQMFTAGAKFSPPLIALVLRRAYGLGAMAMAGGSLHASDITLAWPSGEFGAMGLEGAVQLGMRDRLAAIDDPAKREQEFTRLVDELYERGKALNAAMFFEFDDVIVPNETRTRLTLALNAASSNQR